MTLMDAPKFDAARSQRRLRLFYSILAGMFVFLVAFWLFAGRPIDYPWTWWSYWAGERVTDQFLHTVESNDLPKAYGIWLHDPNWQQHPDKYARYPFDRFKAAFGPDSQDNDYGTINSHVIIARQSLGTDIIVAALINGRKSEPLFLAYDRNNHTLGFSAFKLRLNR